MKKNLKLMAIIFAVCIAAVSMACALVNTDSKTPYTYTVRSNTDSLYSVLSDGSRVPYGEYDNPNAPSTHTISYSGQDYQLNYTISEARMFSNVDSYATADGKVEAEYTAGTNELRNLTFNPPEFLPGEDVVTEEDYKLFVKDVISQFAQEDFELYSYECTTSIQGEDAEREGFVERTADNAVATYAFTYTIVKNGEKTTDRIYVVMFFDTDIMSLSFALNMHEFDNVTLPEINESRLNATITEGMQAYAAENAIEGTVYDGSWTLDNAKWHMINGVPTYICNVFSCYKTESGEESYGIAASFYIQPTVESGDVTE